MIFPCEPFPTRFAFVWFFSSVNTNVTIKVSSLWKTCSTRFANVDVFSSVHLTNIIHCLTLGWKPLSTRPRYAKSFLSINSTNVKVWVSFLCKPFGTSLTLELSLFPTARTQVFSQAATILMYLITSYGFIVILGSWLGKTRPCATFTSSAQFKSSVTLLLGFNFLCVGTSETFPSFFFSTLCWSKGKTQSQIRILIFLNSGNKDLGTDPRLQRTLSGLNIPIRVLPSWSIDITR